MGKTKKLTTQIRQEVTATQLLLGLTEKIIKDYDSHPLNLKPLIHHHGQLKFKNGLDHPLTNSTTGKKPKSSSDIITAYELASQQILQLEYITSTDFLACPRYDSFLLSKYDKGFIGITNNQFLELQGTYTPHSVKKDCYLISLESVDSISLEKDIKLLPYVRALIPIIAHYSIYLDQENNLRYLSHYGKKVKENQPIFQNITQLNFHVESFLDNKAYAFKAVFTYLSGQSSNWIKTSQLRHLNQDNFIFPLSSLSNHA